MARVHLDGISKRYGATVAVDDVTLHVADGEFVVLLGPSGCGKSTLLRMIAGLDEPSAGEIRIGDDVVNDVAAQHRDIAMVFQSYALYPNMSVRRNIAFPLGPRKVPRREQDRLVAAAAELLGLGDLLDRKPAQLSGGQRQRVALARAIVREPRVFLMDEPLSNLDAKLRGQTRVELVALQRRLGTTFVYVTHDQVEAMTMAHRIAILDGGRLQQVGPPAEVYARPANLFVARFIGSPPMNTRPITVDGRDYVLGVRPEHLVVQPGPAPAVPRSSGHWPAEVRFCESLGHEQHLTCRLVADAAPVDVAPVDVVVRLDSDAEAPPPGTSVVLVGEARHQHWFDPADGARVEAPVGGDASSR